MSFLDMLLNNGAAEEHTGAAQHTLPAENEQKLSECTRSEKPAFSCEITKRPDVPQLEMTFQQAQKAGFQFRFSTTRKNKKTVVITSIHVKSGRIVIPARIDGHEVRAIADDCRGIISPDVTEAELYLPKTLARIGKKAFMERVYCGHKTKWLPILTAVYFSSDSTYIGEDAFAAQKNLKELHFGKNTYIGSGAFVHCGALEHVELGICSIENLAFYQCEKLKSVTWQEISVVGAARPFYGTPFERSFDLLILGDTLQKYSGSEETVIVPDGVRAICQSAFYGNSALKKVLLPKTVKTIGTFAFGKCVDLKEIGLESVTEIGRGAFEDCRELGGNIVFNKDVVFQGDPFHRTRLAEESRTPSGVVINNTLVEAKDNYIHEIWRLGSSIRCISDEHGTYDHFYKNLGKTVIIPSGVKSVYSLGVFIGAKRIVIQNPQMSIGRTDIIMAHHAAQDFVVCIKTQTGNSEFPFYYPKWKDRYPEFQRQCVLYSRFFRCCDLGVYEYDEDILNVGLTYRQMLDIAYKRLIGGYRLHEKHRENYERFVRTHRKKGLKYAAEKNDAAQVEFFTKLFAEK